jgi:SAM-dependent methyltransferase
MLERETSRPATANATALGKRVDMTQQKEEAWRPPVFTPTSTPSQRRVASLRRFLDLQAGTVWRDMSAILPTCEGRVLDVGCGAQPYRSLLGPRARYLGIDTAEAKAHFGYEAPDTVYFQGEHWPIDDTEIDVVLCTETLEHVPDPVGFLSEAARVLRPGGRLILTVPFSARYHFIPYDYWRFTPASLERLLSRHFESIAVFARGNAVTVACYKAMALVFPLWFTQARLRVVRFLSRVAGIAMSPFVFGLAAIANISALGSGGDDCLGYTVLARRLADPEHAGVKPDDSDGLHGLHPGRRQR